MDALESLKAFRQYIEELLEARDFVDIDNVVKIREKKTKLIQQMKDAEVAVPRDWVSTGFAFHTGGPRDDIGCTIHKDGLSVLKQLVGVMIKDYQSDDVDDYLPAMSPSECAKKLSRHLSTLKRWKKNGKLRYDVETTRLWRLHRQDFFKLGGKL